MHSQPTAHDAGHHTGSAPHQPPTDAHPLRWVNRFHALGEPFSVPCAAQAFPDPHWIAINHPLADQLGLPDSWWDAGPALDFFTGQSMVPGATPVASVYSGHQFGFWAGRLGDGRALLLGELASPSGTWEIQLKGAGRTPYSRSGDGRAVLRSSIREYLCSEALHGLGIPTTRALCVAGSSLPVWREHVETAAIVTRVAPSFVRFGHFEHFAFNAQDAAALKTLADHVIDLHRPDCRDAADPYAALLQDVTERTARLIADWQAVGFCHGVMNTDNMSILGLTIDYGPFGFLDAYDPEHICNHSDDGGRYAYQNQPQVAWWNLNMLGRALAPLISDVEAVKDALGAFKPAFGRAMLACWQAKLGLESMEGDAPALVDDLFKLLASQRVDYTIFFRRLCGFSAGPAALNEAVRDLFLDRPAFDAWAARYAACLRRQARPDTARADAMRRVNPKYVLRNHLAQTAIDRAQAGDFSEVQRLQRLLQRPFDEQPEHEADAGFPPDWAPALQVSCSS